MMTRVHKFQFKRPNKSQKRSKATEPGSQPTRLAWQLAFAHRAEREIAEGVFENRAAAARHYGITRARMTQLLDLLLLPHEVQEGILGLRGDGCWSVASERSVRVFLLGSVSSSREINESSSIQHDR